MAGVKKPTPMEAFEDNMRDAHHLVRLAEALTNTRTRKMRAELRERVGRALDTPKKDWPGLDCLESRDLFVTFLPGGQLSRGDFDDPCPLLRQAVVAACAATETYLADKVMSRVGPLLQEDNATRRLRALPMTLGDWLELDHRYPKKKRWGLRTMVVEPHVRASSSTASNRFGEMLSLIGVENWAVKLDQQRGVTKGETVGMLDRMTARRNKIAHQGDRDGRGRARLTVKEVKADLASLESIVAAVETLVVS